MYKCTNGRPSGGLNMNEKKFIFWKELKIRGHVTCLKKSSAVFTSNFGLFIIEVLQEFKQNTRR